MGNNRRGSREHEANVVFSDRCTFGYLSPVKQAVLCVQLTHNWVSCLDTLPETSHRDHDCDSLFPLYIRSFMSKRPVCRRPTDRSPLLSDISILHRRSLDRSFCHYIMLLLSILYFIIHLYRSSNRCPFEIVP